MTEQSARATRVLDDLYRHHAAEIYRYAYAVLGNHADAEDVTQATFVNALRALERGESPRKPSNWLLVIAHNLIRQRFRQAQARPAEVALNDEVARAAQERDDDDAPTVDELIKALGRIPATQREAIVMREFEGRSYAEIVEILGITTSALETLLFRARRSLAEELENLVTCQRAEEDVSRLLDGRLTRREKRRLLEHVRSCPSCARFEAFQRKQRRALKGLALLPLPASLTLFKGVHGASAAVGLPTIGAGATGASMSAAAGGGAATGGLALGGAAAAKVAAVVAAAVVAGGASYEGVTHANIGSPAHPGAPAAGHATRGANGAAHSAKAKARSHGAGARGHAVSAAAHEKTHKNPKPRHAVGRRQVPGGLVNGTGSTRAKGKSTSGGPASGNAYGGATRTHGSASGKSANGRGAGVTKSATTKTLEPKTTPTSGHIRTFATSTRTKIDATGGGAAAETTETTIGSTTDVAGGSDGNAGANGVAAGHGNDNSGKK